MEKLKKRSGKMKIRFLSNEEAASRSSSEVVPVYRVKGEQRQLMAYAQRDDALRGVIEIRVIGDGDMEIVRSKNDA
jgi:hypothetical protein